MLAVMPLYYIQCTYLAKYVYPIYTMCNSFFYVCTAPRPVNVSTIETLTSNNGDVIIYWKVRKLCAIYYGVHTCIYIFVIHNTGA